MNFHGKDIKVFTATAYPALGAQIAERLGVPLGRATVGRFSDGEIAVSIQESVRGSDVFVVQPTCAPVNDHVMELLILMDAFKRASAARITAVIPYFGYARQDRKARSRDPISAKLVADLLTTAGADRIVTMDLHAPQIQGFFNIPVDNLLGGPVLAPYFAPRVAEGEYTVVSPDLGSVTRARNFAARLDCPIAIVDKRRQRANVSEVMHVIGEVEGRHVILVDDMIDTAGTLCNAAAALMAHGARSVVAAATHAVLSGPAVQRIEDSPLEQVVVLDTIPGGPEAHPGGIWSNKLTVLPVAPVFAEAIERIYADKPISTMFV